jgi:hypothetical protein
MAKPDDTAEMERPDENENSSHEGDQESEGQDDVSFTGWVERARLAVASAAYAAGAVGGDDSAAKAALDDLQHVSTPEDLLDVDDSLLELVGEGAPKAQHALTAARDEVVVEQERAKEAEAERVAAKVEEERLAALSEEERSTALAQAEIDAFYARAESEDPAVQAQLEQDLRTAWPLYKEYLALEVGQHEAFFASRSPLEIAVLERSFEVRRPFDLPEQEGSEA